jgi:hypothetical protein
VDWTLVTVVPNTEPKVKAALERCEFRHHIFRHRETVVRHGRRVALLRFTFPRYAFVPLELWRPIAERIDQVVGPVRSGDTIAQLPEGVVEELAASCIAPDILPAIRKPARFAPGECVTIDASGPMAGQSDVYLRPTSFGRCQGRAHRVRTPRARRDFAAAGQCDRGDQAQAVQKASP